MGIEIGELTADDWPRVRAIYLEGIATGNATFEISAPEWTAWDAAHLPRLRFTARVDSIVSGWTALSRVSDRCVYGGVAEASVYIAETARRKGVGRALLSALIEDSEREGIWTLQAGIFPENEASVALFTRAGFRIVGRRERIGQMNGRWRDTLLLERRSSLIGI